ncbi:MAG: transcription antitermination factor NusB [Beutenbergiaceae bacterium]
MGARTKARKRAIDLAYEADQRALSADQSLASTMSAVLAERIAQPGTQTALPEYSVELVEGLASKLSQIDELLQTYSMGWTLPRMPAVDRAILRIATWELLYNDAVPDVVAIDEAVDLATSLSTDDSPTFINGLLGRLLQLKPSLLD